MCLICTDFKAGKLRIDEARNNLNEMGEQLLDHKQEVEMMLFEAENMINSTLDEYEERLTGLPFGLYDNEDFRPWETLNDNLDKQME
jgi:hypothetical protein|tara:strand:+ start:1105 stop:1365 length:261 start_codon:yes stop_codon:yes gene_type:complete